MSLKLIRVYTRRFILRCKFLDVFLSLWITELLRRIFVGTCSGNVIRDIRVELVGGEIAVAFVGVILTVVSVLFSIGFNLTEIVCISNWNSAFCWFFFSTVSFSNFWLIWPCSFIFMIERSICSGCWCNHIG